MQPISLGTFSDARSGVLNNVRRDSSFLERATDCHLQRNNNTKDTPKEKVHYQQCSTPHRHVKKKHHTLHKVTTTIFQI
jgi:hypothetical protein